MHPNSHALLLDPRMDTSFRTWQSDQRSWSPSSVGLAGTRAIFNSDQGLERSRTDRCRSLLVQACRTSTALESSFSGNVYPSIVTTYRRATSYAIPNIPISRDFTAVLQLSLGQLLCVSRVLLGGGQPFISTPRNPYPPLSSAL